MIWWAQYDFELCYHSGLVHSANLIVVLFMIKWNHAYISSFLFSLLLALPSRSPSLTFNFFHSTALFSFPSLWSHHSLSLVPLSRQLPPRLARFYCACGVAVPKGRQSQVRVFVLNRTHTWDKSPNVVILSTLLCYRMARIRAANCNVKQADQFSANNRVWPTRPISNQSLLPHD